MSRVSSPAPRLARRRFLASASAAAAVAATGGLGAPWLRPARADDAAAPFSFDLLTERMRALAAEPHVPPPRIEGPLAALGYDDHRLLQFDPARRRPIGPRTELAAFAPGWLFREPVELFLVTDGRAEPLVVADADFVRHGDLADRLPPLDALPGVAGFRLHHPLNRPDVMDELVAFLGASYFRALGRGSIYGLSARGLALNTATSRPEEFPRFSRFYLEPGPGPDGVTAHAALESPSVTGAYRFVIVPGAPTVIEVACRLFFRADVGELGVAPLTSMFLYADVNRAGFDDFRPKVHDSDGLRIERADGDVIWRPLNNPPRLTGGWFPETAPRRFGLHQRDRRFDSYQDAEANYHRRPSLDVEPLGDWGAGHVRLVEIPTDMETNDNIVAFWVPEAPVAAGDAREFAYRLHWGDLPADLEADRAVVAATRAGHGGVSGVEAPTGVRKFAVDFAGGLPGRLGPEAQLAPVAAVAGGTLLTATLDWLPEARVWRLVIDVEAGSDGVVELTAHLAGHGRKLSEDWVAQWTPA